MIQRCRAISRTSCAMLLCPPSSRASFGQSLGKFINRRTLVASGCTAEPILCLCMSCVPLPFWRMSRPSLLALLRRRFQTELALVASPLVDPLITQATFLFRRSIVGPLRPRSRTSARIRFCCMLIEFASMAITLSKILAAGWWSPLM